MGSLLQDLRFAFRTLRRSPGFALTAILTLAIGIGGSTTIFSVVNGVVLRPLPYPEPDRLLRLNNAWEGTPNGAVSPAEYFDYRERLRSVSAMGVYAGQDATLTGGDAPERVAGGYLSAGVFGVLGVAPVAGRVFTEEEDRPGSDAVAVLGYALWTRRFGADPAVVGSRIIVDGAPRTVVGVMPPDFRLPDDLATGGVTELFLPVALDRAAAMNRGSHFLEAIGRLQPGATTGTAAAEMGRVAAGFVREYANEYPEQMRFTASATPLAASIVGEARPLLLMLLGAVGLVLLIACSNVASLLLARADRRQRELAVRAALGAKRGRIVRQLFLESILLALCSGAAGVLLAVWATTALPLLAPPSLPRLDAVRVDPRVLAFALGASLLSALLFGLAPAWYAARSSIESALREGGRGHIGGGRRQRLRSSLVAAEVAVAVLLLVGAGLLTRSVAALYAVDPGYRTDGVLTMSLSLPAGDYPDQAAVGGFYRAALERLAAVPGVRAAGAVSNLPLTGTLGDLNFTIEGREVGEGESKPRGDWQVVTPGYFRAVGMRLLRGRGIEPSDDADAPGATVINESLAALYWPGADPIGQRLLLGGGAGPGWVTVVGVVGDVRQSGLDAAPRPEFYLPHAQFSFWNGGGPVRSMSLALRTEGDPMAVAGPARAEIRALDPNLPVAELRTLDQVRAASAAQPRFLSLLLGVFSAMALLLAAVGIYGTLSYLVAQRTREFGIRMALGARASEIMGMVLGRGASLTVAGVAVGLAAALFLTRLLAGLLYGVTSTDAITYAAAPTVLLGVALLACWLPARRATRVDPMVALRGE